MTVAAAVTTFNRLDSLKRCIDAIRAQDRPVDEIIVVNDLSTDGTREWLDSQSDLIAIHQPANYGCACSFHTVLKAAYDRGHDFAWAMDDDVFPEPNSLGILLETAAELAQQGVKIGGLTAYQAHWDQGGTTWLPFRLPSTVARALRYRYLSPEVGIERGKGEPKEIDLYAFISTLFTREAMAAVGFPNQDFFYYGEDTDYALRLAEHGFKSFIVPKLRGRARRRRFHVARAPAGLVQLALLLHVPQSAGSGAPLWPPARADQAHGLPGAHPDGPLQAPRDGIAPRQLRRLQARAARRRRRLSRPHGQARRPRGHRLA